MVKSSHASCLDRRAPQIRTLHEFFGNLIVDDSTGIRKEVEQFLTEQGYDVLTAEDGLQGFQKVESHPELQLMIVDVNMPDMDGLTMVEKIRNELQNDQILALMLTTESQPHLKRRAKAAGVKGWLVKPFNGPGTLAVIKSLLG